MYKSRGYAPGVDGPEARDLIAEAGRIARRESLMIASGEHMTPLVATLAETLELVLEDYDRLQADAIAAGRGSFSHHDRSAGARSILARLNGEHCGDRAARETREAIERTDAAELDASRRFGF